MNNNIINIVPNANVPEALRNIADDFESGEIAGENCTLVIGLKVYHLGCVDNSIAVTDAIFNMTYGIQRLMRPAIDEAIS